jgi:general secretion pathway protein C
MMKLWTVKITTFLLWALAAGSATFWVLQNVHGASPSQSDAATKAAPLPSTAAEQNLTPQVAIALGAKNPITPTAASALAAMQARFQLQGVLSVGGKSGAALISVDGKPAKPYRLGVTVEDGLEVIAVKAREASMGSNGVTAFTLELPRKDYKRE